MVCEGLGVGNVGIYQYFLMLNEVLLKKFFHLDFDFDFL